MIPTNDSNYRICDNCGAVMHDGYILGQQHACCKECAVALYDGDEKVLRQDLDEESHSTGSSDCMYVDSF